MRPRYSTRWPATLRGEVTIFNPRLDPSSSIAPRLADLIAFAVLSREDTEPGT